MIDEIVKKEFGSWKAFCEATGQDSTNFKRKLLANIEKLNKWLEPLDLEVQIINKREKHGIVDNILDLGKE